MAKALPIAARDDRCDSSVLGSVDPAQPTVAAARLDVEKACDTAGRAIEAKETGTGGLKVEECPACVDA